MGTGADVVKDGPIFLRIVPAITSSAPPIPEQGAHSYLSFYFSWISNNKFIVIISEDL